MPLKAVVVDAQNDEYKQIRPHNILDVLQLSSKILAFLSHHAIQIKVWQTICNRTLPLFVVPNPLKDILFLINKMLSGLILMLQMGCFLNNRQKNILYTCGYFDTWICFQLWPTCLKIFGEPWSDNKGSAQRGISRLRLMRWLILVEVYEIDMLCCGINKWKGEVPWFCFSLVVQPLSDLTT